MVINTKLLLLLPTLLVSICHAQSSLPQLKINTDSITVSGISSGAYFATQFHVAFSSQIAGSGTWAGGPYLCYARDGLLCMSTPSLINVGALLSMTEDLAIDGKIDLTKNLADDKVYIVQGTEDRVVYPASAEKLYEYWMHHTDSNNIVLKNDLPASHAVISDHVGTACGVSDERLFIENCGFDSIYNMLNHINGGSLTQPKMKTNQQGRLLEFDQNEFFGGNAKGASMDDTGYIYIPPACEPNSGSSTCLLHIFFHGCSMHADKIGTEFITTSGFLEIADANNMVIIFPQTISKTLTNPYACYNWFGYLNDLLYYKYATKKGEQMAGCHAMMRRVTGLL